MATKHKKNHILLIKWHDSVRESEWQEHKEYQIGEEDSECYTLGRFVKESELFITVCSNWSVHNMEDDNIGMVMTIPRATIISIKKIKTL